MNTETLNTFLTLANNNSFTKTAKTLFISQSTVSDRIQNLESEIGRPLFHRTAAGAVLTAAGYTLLPYAQQLVELSKQAIEQSALVGHFNESISIATAENLFDTAVAYILSDFASKQPGCALNIELGHSEEILPHIRNYDIAFTYFPCFDNRYICEEFLLDEIILITDSHNTDYQSGIHSSQLSDIQLINVELLQLSDVIQYSTLRIFPLQINIISKAIAFLENSNRYCFTLKQAVLKQLQDGSLIEIPLLDIVLPRSQTYIVYRKDYQEDDYLRELVQKAKKYVIDKFS